jgi:tRNA/rRNA methyltransferase
LTDINLDNVAVVLLRPKLSENIGTAARAASNMGLGGLRVASPYRFEDDIIRTVATKGAEALVDRIEVFDDLDSALADFQYVIGTTARMGSHRGPFFSPRDMAEKVVELGSDMRVALLFGPERTGLSTADLRKCHMVVRIPTANKKQSSLNLAQAVLILGYELLLAHSPKRRKSKFKPAPFEEVEAMYRRLTQALLLIGFLPEENTDHWLTSFRRIFNRSGLTQGDCNLLSGVCRQIRWGVRTGGKPQHLDSDGE